MYSTIKEQFSWVIQYSQNIPEPELDDLFDDWAKAKAKFIKRFGGLIYEWPEPIEFQLDDVERKRRATEFADDVFNTYHNEELARFIDDNIDTFYENKVSNESSKKIPKGMKLVKAFKYFEKNTTVLRMVQDQASQLIQENKIKGTLCFSVHPLDFLSSSENLYNWRSCHSLDGDYRAGNLSYMVDETTFMVYLKGMDDVKLPNFGRVKWNSKKWRMLLHASTNDCLMFAGRQYPFVSRSGLDIVLNIYNNIISENAENDKYWGKYRKYDPWKCDYVDTYVPKEGVFAARDLSTKYFVYENTLFDINKYIKEGPGAMNYNDLLRSTIYKYPYYTHFPSYMCFIGNNPIEIGETVKCLHCGNFNIEHSDTMRCDDCELEYGHEENDYYGHCACCGRRIYYDDSYIVDDCEDAVCEYCYDTETFSCHACGVPYYNEHRNFIAEDKDGEEGHYYCPHCYEELMEEE